MRSEDTNNGRTMTAAEVARELAVRVAPAVGRAPFERFRAALLALVAPDAAAVSAVAVVRWGDGDVEASALVQCVPLWNSLVTGALVRDVSPDARLLATAAAQVGGAVVRAALASAGVSMEPPTGPARETSADAAQEAPAPSAPSAAAAETETPKGGG